MATVADLKAILKNAGFVGYSKMRKSELQAEVKRIQLKANRGNDIDQVKSSVNKRKHTHEQNKLLFQLAGRKLEKATKQQNRKKLLARELPKKPSKITAQQKAQQKADLKYMLDYHSNVTIPRKLYKAEKREQLLNRQIVPDNEVDIYEFVNLVGTLKTQIKNYINFINSAWENPTHMINSTEDKNAYADLVELKFYYVDIFAKYLKLLTDVQIEWRNPKNLPFPRKVKYDGEYGIRYEHLRGISNELYDRVMEFRNQSALNFVNNVKKIVIEFNKVLKSAPTDVISFPTVNDAVDDILRTKFNNAPLMG